MSGRKVLKLPRSSLVVRPRRPFVEVAEINRGLSPAAQHVCAQEPSCLKTPLHVARTEVMLNTWSTSSLRFDVRLKHASFFPLSLG